MKTEHDRAAGDAAGVGGAAPGGLDTEIAHGGFDHVWDLGRGRSTPVEHPGDRLADWNLAAMLRPAVRDVMAIWGRPARGLVIAAGEGWLAHRLLEWGVESVTAIEERGPALRRASLLRDHFAWKEGEFELRRGSPTSIDPAELGRFEIVVASLACERLACDRAALLRFAHATSRGLCAIVTTDRVGATLAAQGAGFNPVHLMPPPTDAERRFILSQRSLLIAKRPDDDE